MAIDRVASPGYFHALRVPLVRGRDFDARDAQSSVPVAIVNRTMAERRWPESGSDRPEHQVRSCQRAPVCG